MAAVAAGKSVTHYCDDLPIEKDAMPLTMIAGESCDWDFV